jgi:hypothetical protein
MSNMIDSIGHAFEKAKDYIEEHPLQTAAALIGFPIVGPALAAGAVMTEDAVKRGLLPHITLKEAGEAATVAANFMLPLSAPGYAVGMVAGEAAARGAGALSGAAAGKGAAEMGKGAAEMGNGAAEVGNGAAEVGKAAAEAAKAGAVVGKAAAEATKH